MRATHLFLTSARRTFRAKRSVAVLVGVVALTFSMVGCGSGSSNDAAAGSVTVENCGRDVSVAAPPERVYAVYQPSAEMMSALGLGDRIVGSSFFDGEFLPEYADAFEGAPYSENNPTREALLATNPDFVFGGYGTVFAADTPNGVGTRASLKKVGIESYVLTPFCPTKDGKTDQEVDPADVTVDAIYNDLLAIGELFGVEDKAEALVAEYKSRIGKVEDAVADADRPTVAYVRPQEDGTFQICGGIDFGTQIIEHAGGVNAFADVTTTRNIYVDAEELIKRDPDVILTNSGFGIDYTLDDAQSDVDKIMKNPAFAGLTAVKNHTVYPSLFADRSAGVRTAHAIEQLAQLIHPDLVG
ncbi:iron complex transport system substrate-binding protein [Brevibacterium sp. Mu109]|uniref:ABC transporter substrate-binding protein n=1 Tax=Brevibacterium sp. Mu109 TaxID=1255669 RepID=UPI000C3B3AD6|nr:ABC transporter substrate-binding protein [Brevibacterium sp. Mu109]MDN5893963.1 ABC transporter substrate-binding protein [Nocardioides sp.]SMX86889.1 iron complex transport system substrate-binding protein [Brevibacterium sp. Mu109]